VVSHTDILDPIKLDVIRTKLFTAVLGDVMDTRGLTRQFLPPEIRALDPDMVVAGYAMPVLEADCCGDVEGQGRQGGGRANPFGLMLRALDDLKRDEVYICTGGSPRYALWGELMSTRARTLGAAGAVVDGFHRDTRGIRGLGFPVFSHGAYAQDQRVRGRVIDFRCAIEFGNGARVNPGDVIVGDIDGVMVIPRVHAADIVSLALEKVEGEEAVRRMIEQGERTEDIFGRTGIM
jgi:regulator of RNase E activity RraA